MSSLAKDLRYVGSVTEHTYSHTLTPIVVVCKITSSRLVTPPPQPNVHVDTSLLSPRLVFGETTQGFMTTNSLSVKVSVEHFLHNHQSASQIQHLL